MRLMLILVALVAAVNASIVYDLLRQEWETYKLTYNLQFKDPREDRYRLYIYIHNRLAIEQHNAKYARGETSFTVGVNQFTHWTKDEMKSMTGTTVPDGGKTRSAKTKPPKGQKRKTKTPTAAAAAVKS